MNKFKLKTLEKKELNNIIAGYNDSQRHSTKDADPCGCACKYEGTPGGSTTSDNRNANKAEGLNS